MGRHVGFFTKYVVIAKGKERYIFLYKEGQEEALKKILRQFVLNAELSFTERDAALARLEIKRQSSRHLHLPPS